jgi:hydrogenase maturation protein HypF
MTQQENPKTLVFQALRIRVEGRVQGVGYRPFVARTARALALSGWVRNRAGVVDIQVEGPQAVLDQFRQILSQHAPPLARPVRLTVEQTAPTHLSGFAILASAADAGGYTHIPPDQVMCADCLQELTTFTERRYRYPFVSCTQCGPRYTLIDRLPFDRPNTAMAGFQLCSACLNQYENPADRRHHAQILACAECGPRLAFQAGPEPSATVNGNEAALSACVLALQEGLIVAVKGVGGYHLLCDASCERAVLRLRQRKQRPRKPLAVLLPWRGGDGLAWADSLAILTAEDRAGLIAPERPIVLVVQRRNSPLAPSIAPCLDEVGLMLPYSPLHYLLADAFDGPLVATSANPGGEPVLTDGTEVMARLGQVADAFLHHDRPIRRPAEDSVRRRIAGHLRPLRLGRGSAPIERRLPFCLAEPLLALGSDLKNTVALAFADRCILSPHIGDLGSVRGRAVFEQTITDLTRLYGVAPRHLICDAHPDYHSGRWALNRNLPLHRVFHHRAHASALAGEHGVTAPLLVLTWDGTGYGEDGTAWGGETFYGRPGDWRRVGSLRPFRLPGGDAVSREGWRSACAVAWEIGLNWPGCPRESRLLRHIWDRHLNCPLTPSAGRLFDAAAALIGLVFESSYEGEAAMRLEALASRCGGAVASVTLPLIQSPQGIWLSDWAPLLPLLMNPGFSPATRAAVFHASLAQTILDQAEQQRALRGVTTVGLTGGVFQNRLLTEMAEARLQRAGFRVLLAGEIPANDAGLCFGQIIEYQAKSVSSTIR